MHCHNCNSQVNTNENFCRNCGAKINTTHQNQTSNMQSQTQYQTQSQAYYQTQEGISVSQRIANSMNRVEIDPEEELINAYIGEKANELKKDFSWCTFLFGVFYPIYRKMWGFAIIWFIINLVATVIFPGSGTIIRIIAAVIFKELYVKTVRKRVNKIKEQNPGKSHEDLLLICSKKGGTSILSVILFSIFSVIMIIAVIIIIFAILIATDYENQTDYNIENKEIIFNDIYLKLPGKMEEKINNNDWYGASYTGQDDSCRIDIYKVNKEQCLTSEECVQNLKDPELKYMPAIRKNINYKTWDYRYATRIKPSSELQNEYHYYFIEYIGILYGIEYKTQKEGAICKEARELLEESIEFQGRKIS